MTTKSDERSHPNEHKKPCLRRFRVNKIRGCPHLNYECAGKWKLSFKVACFFKGVTLDMSDSYKSFAKSFFPNADLVADRFHVERLIQPLMLSHRIEITGDQRRNPVRLLMNRKRKNLEFWERTKLDTWLRLHPKMNELYSIKEQIGRFYEIRGYHRAEIAFNKILVRLSQFEEPALKAFYKTLTRWKQEILNFFKFRVTNARVEGFNNVAKVIKRMSYGFRSFKNYRLRLLTACS